MIEDIDSRLIPGTEKEVFLTKEKAVEWIKADWGTANPRSDYNQDGRVNALDFNTLARLPMGSRNPMCWAAGIELSCASPYNSAGHNLQAGTLIHPEWISLAAHYGYGKGVEVTFVSMDHQTAHGIIDGVAVIPGTDILLAHLDRAMPNYIVPAKILPDDWTNEIVNYGNGIPALVFDQEEKALITDVSSLEREVWLTRYSANARRMDFYEEKISGDSGNPIFWVQRKEVIILGHLMYGGSGRGPSYQWYAPQIEEAIGATLGRIQL